jgi:LPS-assembly protein
MGENPVSRLNRLTGRHAAAALLLASAWPLAVASPLHAQTSARPAATRPAVPPAQAAAPVRQPDRLAVEAREVVFNNDTDQVEARGDAQLYYQGRVLEADRVVYDRKTKRVTAFGNVKMTERNGQIVYGDRFELTDDFKDGFIDSMRVVTHDRQRFSAARGERIDGETTIFDRGTYTSCEPCKDNPEKPPLWQVKAKRIISRSSEQVIYYEDASIEFLGVPIGWVPFFSAPDPSVTRKSGFLTPRYVHKGALGYGVQIPYYWAIAPNYDLLYTATPLSRQGLLNEVEWRHRLETGIYNIRAAGIFQADPRAYQNGPSGPNYSADATYPNGRPRKFRGSVESTGKFLINDRWKFGWDVSLQSDKYFLNNYKVRSNSITNNFYRESISSVYLSGRGQRSWFDLSGYHFQGLTVNDWQKTMPTVHPVLDFNRRFTPPGIGGELNLDINAISLSRDAAQYEGVPTAAQNTPLGRVNKPWQQTQFMVGAPGAQGPYLTTCAVYVRGQCLVRGIGGTSNRATANISWRREFIDPLGQVWTPFAFMQADAVNYNLNTSRYNSVPYGNAYQTGFLGNRSEDSFGRFMPGVGLEYRYPLIASSSFGTHVIEPIAQVIARPNERKIGRMPNEDAQSLVFDDTNLFAWNKFSGYDRTEGGTRLNYGGQYTHTGPEGRYVNMLFGQSVHLSGRNSFATPDLVNTGLNSGLDKKRSDYVARTRLYLVPNLGIAARGRFDEASWKLRRFELEASAAFGQLSTTAMYARYDAQPELGQIYRREALLGTAKLKLPNNWHISGDLLFDLDRYLIDRDLSAAFPATYPTYNKNQFRLSRIGLGIGYQDECTTFSFQYYRGLADNLGATNQTAQVFLFKLELKHLGQVNFSQTTGPVSLDGTSR